MPTRSHQRNTRCGLQGRLLIEENKAEENVFLTKSWWGKRRKFVLLKENLILKKKTLVKEKKTCSCKRKENASPAETKRFRLENVNNTFNARWILKKTLKLTVFFIKLNKIAYPRQSPSFYEYNRLNPVNKILRDEACGISKTQKMTKYNWFLKISTHPSILYTESLN